MFIFCFLFHSLICCVCTVNIDTAVGYYMLFSIIFSSDTSLASYHCGGQSQLRGAWVGRHRATRLICCCSYGPTTLPHQDLYCEMYSLDFFIFWFLGACILPPCVSVFAVWQWVSLKEKCIVPPVVCGYFPFLPANTVNRNKQIISPDQVLDMEAKSVGKKKKKKKVGGYYRPTPNLCKSEFIILHSFFL